MPMVEDLSALFQPRFQLPTCVLDLRSRAFRCFEPPHLLELHDFQDRLGMQRLMMKVEVEVDVCYCHCTSFPSHQPSGKYCQQLQLPLQLQLRLQLLELSSDPLHH